MNLEKDKHLINEIKSIIKTSSGLVFDLYRENSLKKKITKRLQTLNIPNIEDYLKYLKKNISYKNFSEIESVISELTVNETSFFRDLKQFKFLEKYASTNFSNKNGINILCLGCATGEEPYSITMSLLELFPGAAPQKFKILACDIDKQALDTKMKYVPDSFRLQNLPPHYLKKYFDLKDNYYSVKNFLNNYIEFKYFNVVNDIIPGKYDIIFFKNVIMYFDIETKNQVVLKAFRALNDSGIIFFGITEIINDLPNDIKKITAEKCNVFKKVSNSIKNSYTSSGTIYKVPASKEKIKTIPAKKSDLISNNYIIKEIKGNIDEELNNSEYKSFYNLMNEVLEYEKIGIIFDFSNLIFISRDSLEKLLKIYTILQNNHCQVIFVIPNESWKNYLKRMDVNNNLLILESISEALFIFNN